MEDKIKHFRTTPFDPRFPQVNQTRHCQQDYLDYHRCMKVLGEKGKDTTQCDWFKKCYKSICPSEWVDRWDGFIEEGTFPGKI